MIDYLSILVADTIIYRNGKHGSKLFAWVKILSTSMPALTLRMMKKI
jgi:hypothetical protein